MSLIALFVAQSVALAALASTPTRGVDTAAVQKLRAEAQAVIRAASAQSHFVDDTRWDMPAVRHRASGLRCLF